MSEFDQSADTSSETTAEATTADNIPPSRKNRLQRLSQKYQIFEDKIVPWKLSRWGTLCFLLFLYFLRVFVFVGGLYFVTYTMCIHLLYCLVGTRLPSSSIFSNSKTTTGNSEHKQTFIAKVQEEEFKIWKSMFRIILLAILCTFFDCEWWISLSQSSSWKWTWSWSKSWSWTSTSWSWSKSWSWSPSSSWTSSSSSTHDALSTIGSE